VRVCDRLETSLVVSYADERAQDSTECYSKTRERDSVFNCNASVANALMQMIVQRTGSIETPASEKDWVDPLVAIALEDEERRARYIDIHC
jgi:hypothetical protein